MERSFKTFLNKRQGRDKSGHIKVRHKKKKKQQYRIKIHHYIWTIGYVRSLLYKGNTQIMIQTENDVILIPTFNYLYDTPITEGKVIINPYLKLGLIPSKVEVSHINNIYARTSKGEVISWGDPQIKKEYKENKKGEVIIKMPSGKTKKIKGTSLSLPYTPFIRNKKPKRKGGGSHNLGIRPTVRGETQNAVDHKLGGRNKKGGKKYW